MSQSHIRIRGARTHNLKNVNLDIPRDKFVVITGLSGSGKTKLAQAFAKPMRASSCHKWKNLKLTQLKV